MARKKILLLNPIFDLQKPRSIRTQNIFNILNSNFDIHLLKFKHPVIDRRLTSSTIHKLEISRVSSFFFNYDYSTNRYSSSSNIFRRLISFLYNKFSLFPDLWSYEISKVHKYFKKTNHTFDFIIASIKPFSSAELSTKLKKLSAFQDAKIILDIGDPLTNNSADEKKNLEKKEKYEKKYLRIADHLIVTNYETKDYYIKSYNISAEQISIVPQGVNLDVFSKNTMSHKSLSKLNLIYAGNFYKTLRDPDPFISAIEKLDSSIDISVDFFGTKLAKHTTIKTHDSISQQELSLAYQRASILMFFDNAFGIQTSGKIYELLALRKPILFIYSNESSSTLTLVKDFHNVILVKNNKDTIYNKLLNLRQILDNMDPIIYSANQFSWESRAEKFKEIINSLSS